MRRGMSGQPTDELNPFEKYRREVAETQVVASLRTGILVVVGLHLPFLLLDYSFYQESFNALAIGRATNALSLAVVYGLARRWPVPRCCSR